jgi:hypothetical protein
MDPRSPTGKSGDAPDARELSGRTLARIEELVADAAIGDALNVLQDMVRDFAREDMIEVRELREKHIVSRRDNNRDTMLALREGILDLAYRVDEKLQSGPSCPQATCGENTRA